jgi:hypothetical protein
MPTSVLFASGLRWLDITAPVGHSYRTGRQVNDKLDVMLVQFMLKRCVENLTRGAAVGPPMVVDGTFGMHTHYYICLYQRDISGSESVLNVTGHIEPFDYANPRDPMRRLNEDFFFAVGNGLGVISVKDLFQLLPVQLHQSLKYVIDDSGRPTKGAR